jgi:phage terminase small subunit
VKPATDRQRRFVEEYIVDLNGTQAAIRAGYSKRTAKNAAYELLQNPIVIAALKKVMDARSARTQITADDVLRELEAIARVDANELVQHRRLCCRYCHGTEFRYQRTRAEMDRERGAWESKQTKRSQEAFDEQGGIGYRRVADPNPACPECCGEGIPDVHIVDTRKLSPAARSAYAGVKVTKDGIELKTHDKVAALKLVGEHFAMFRDQPPVVDPADTVAKVRAALRAAAEADGLAA